MGGVSGERPEVRVPRPAAFETGHPSACPERLALGESYLDGEDLVFTWQDGRPVPPDYVTSAFRRLTTGLELPRITFHSLRHTHATVLLREEVPVHVVAKRLGHKDPSVTLNVYADAIPDDDDRAVTTFSKAVWGA